LLHSGRPGQIIRTYLTFFCNNITESKPTSSLRKIEAGYTQYFAKSYAFIFVKQ
jgi:hypothetical protein